ncbi:hypothetical protein FQR65_LT15738 [Abscondita terminalis]|nr:hypothetical protein FQR65_LT15738 [Abscondita terminalis]
MDIYDLKCKINNELVTITVPTSEEDIIFKLSNDNEFLVSYIINLINNGFISLDEELSSIHRIENDSEILIYPALLDDNRYDSSVEAATKSNEWNDAETIFLLNDYESYVSQVGPMKRFKTKKAMWMKIADNLNIAHNIKRTGVQVENRYKTVLKRKKVAVENNSKSGAARMDIPFESELGKIAALDDSIEPEILRSASGVTALKSQTPELTNSPSGSRSSTPKRRTQTIQELLIELHQQKEEAKERRHKEKLALIKELFNNRK